MSSLDNLVVALETLKTKMAVVGGAVNDLEAKVTAALKQSGISAEDQAKIDQAFATVQELTGVASTIAADAADGVDEAAVVAPAPVDTPPVV